MAQPVLEADQLEVVRGDDTVFSDLTIEIHEGTRSLIQGASGSGKTTLFRVLGLLEPPTSGEILVRGTRATQLSDRQRARIRREDLGIIFQEFHLIPDLTAFENAAVPQDHAGERDEEWLKKLFDLLDLQAQADQYPASLSGGEKQRVAIARALANRPSVILADEPTGQLDPETAQRVLSLLFRSQEQSGAALVVVSHDPTLEPAFETIYRLENGQLSSLEEHTTAGEHDVPQETS